MRRLNTFLVIGILLTFLVHAVMSSFRLLGAAVSTATAAAWLCIGLVSVHVVLTTILTVRTLVTIHRSGKGFFKDNWLFWARRISGFALLIPLVMHLLIFRGTGEEAYRLVFFHSGRLISQILLIACLALHILTNLRPMLIGLGIKHPRILSADVCFVLSVVLLLACIAFCVYYLRWMAY